MVDTLAISIFLGFTSICLILAVMETIDTARDRRRVQEMESSPAAPLAIIADANMRRAVASVIILLLLVGSGASYLIAPAGTPSYTMGLALRVAGLFAILIIVAFLIVSQRVDRQQLNEIAKLRGGTL